MQIKINDVFPTKKLIFKSFNITLGIANMIHSVENGVPILIQLPLTLAEFGLGMYGANSWIHPTDLPPSHPNFCIWKYEQKSIVVHNRTREVCYLLLGKAFHDNGEFKLTPQSGGSGEFKTSVTHTPMSVKSKLDELIGKEMIFQIKILSILVDGIIESSVVLNRTIYGDKTKGIPGKREVSVIFTSIKWLCLASLPLDLLDTTPSMPSKHKKKKWEKRKKQTSSSNT